MKSDRLVIVGDNRPLERMMIAALFTRVEEIGGLAHVEGFDALAAAVDRDPGIHLAVIDWNLPGLNGIEGLRYLRGRHPALRLVVMAPPCSRFTLLQALATGIRGWILRSLSTAEKIAALNAVLTGHVFVPDRPDLDAATGSAAAAGWPRPARERVLARFGHAAASSAYDIRR